MVQLESKAPVPKFTRQSIMEGHDYVTDRSFKLSLDDGKDRQFGVYFETVNMFEATGESEFKNYPFVVSASIVLDKVHRSFDESGEAKPSKLGLILDAVQYMGGVPVDHVLTHEISSSTEAKTKGENANFQKVANQFKVGQAMVVSQTHDFGTIAAQLGKGAEFSHLRFKTEKDASKYIDYLIENRLSALSMLIGFVLDRPINMAGSSGWETIQGMAKGKK